MEGRERERGREGGREGGRDRERGGEGGEQDRHRDQETKRPRVREGTFLGTAQDLELLGSLSLVELVSCTGIASVQDLQPPWTSWKEPCQEGCPFVPCFTNPSLACETSVTSFRF